MDLRRRTQFGLKSLLVAAALVALLAAQYPYWHNEPQMAVTYVDDSCVITGGFYLTPGGIVAAWELAALAGYLGWRAWRRMG
jgi:hypothetical protein